MRRVRRRRFRQELQTVVLDLAGGVRSVGELDLARQMRERGLSVPSRQTVRRRPSGSEYLDAEFDAYALAMEVDGVQLELPWVVLADAVRALTLLSEGPPCPPDPSRPGAWTARRRGGWGAA